MNQSVPFFRPSVGEAEISAVTEVLRSGWLTTGGTTRSFEESFAQFVGARHAVALNSCTAALHLALEAIGLQRGELVLVPTLTFAATAEVVRYFDATPVLIDVDPVTCCMDPDAVEQALQCIERSQPTSGLVPPFGRVRAIIPVHYGGQMADVARLRAIAWRHGIALIEDAAHTLPAAFRESEAHPWQWVGSTGDVTCFSFYANKCITTGEGGMATTNDDALAARMRTMSLHGLSRDAWRRFQSGGSWYYEIIAPGYKYNLTDIAAALGLVQLSRARDLWRERAAIAAAYSAALADIPGIEIPLELPDRQHAWHLYAIRLRNRTRADRDDFIRQLGEAGIGCSVHWMPLHLHPYYRETYGYTPGLFPVAEREWERMVSLPIFPGMRDEEVERVTAAVERFG